MVLSVKSDLSITRPVIQTDMAVAVTLKSLLVEVGLESHSDAILGMAQGSTLRHARDLAHLGPDRLVALGAPKIKALKLIKRINEASACSSGPVDADHSENLEREVIMSAAGTDDFSDDTGSSDEDPSLRNGFSSELGAGSEFADFDATSDGAASEVGSDVGSSVDFGGEGGKVLPGKRSMFSFGRRKAPAGPGEKKPSSTSLPRGMSFLGKTTAVGNKLVAAPIAQLSEASLAVLADSIPFDEELKFKQKAVAEAQKSRKAERKAQVSAEAAKLAKQISHVTDVKKHLLKEIKSIVASGGGGLFDHSEAIDLIEQQEEDEDSSWGSDVEYAKSPLEHDGRSHSPMRQAKPADASGTGGAEAHVYATSGPASHASGSPLEKLRFFEWSGRVLRAQNTALHLDMYFPRSEGWKMRVYIPEEDM